MATETPPVERRATMCDQIAGWAVAPPRDTHLSLSVYVPTVTFDEKLKIEAAIRATIEGFGFRVDDIPSM
jgi:hypothetical protein